MKKENKMNLISINSRVFIILRALFTLLILERYVVNCLSASVKNVHIKASNSDNYNLLLISFDGFRWDYIKSGRANTPNFNKIMEEGVHVTDGLLNAFVTKTFPNHFTLATGLWEESHGIVGNEMYDPRLNQTFNPSNKTANDDPAWFDVGAEPIWVTNKLQRNGSSGICMWVGAGAPIKNVKPTHYIPYNGSMGKEEKVDAIIKWFTDEQPINLGLMYFDEPDQEGHHYGPESQEVTKAIETLDEAVGYLLKRLNETDLLQNMNIIITSDHGFTNTTHDKVINLDKYIDETSYQVSSVSPVALIWPKEGRLEEIYNNLTNGAASNRYFEVYKKEEIPSFYHYTQSWRISPIIVVANDYYSLETNQYKYPVNEIGNHGYDNRLKDMHPFFIAMGPSFKKNFSIDSFDSVDIYPLMCHLLHLDPAPNNGSLSKVSLLLIPAEPSILRTILTYLFSIAAIVSVAILFSVAAFYYKHKSGYVNYTFIKSDN